MIIENRIKDKEAYREKAKIALAINKGLLVLFIFLLFFVFLYFTLNKNSVDYDIIEPNVIERYITV